MEELIIKYLNKDLSPEEELRFKAWLQEDESNRQVFEHMVANWLLNQKDLQASKKKIYQKIINSPTSRLNQNYNSLGNFWQTWLKVAAILLIALTSGLVILNFQQTEQPTELQVVTQIEKYALPGQKLSITLPDGTVVKLNSDSRLRAPQQFTGKSRQVYLEGEAFFEVTEDASRPFVVNTDNFTIQVLGTSFNVSSYQQELKSSIAVVTGKVMVSRSSNAQEAISETLTPDQMLVYSSKKRSWVKQNGFNPDLVLGWRDQKLFFKEDRISTILKTLARWYGVEFQVETNLNANREYTARFNNPSLKEVMESLSYNYQFKYEINDEKVIIQ
jgi:transmembrane sensor